MGETGKVALSFLETSFYYTHQFSLELTILLQLSEYSDYGHVALDLARQALLCPLAKMWLSGLSEGSRDCIPGSAPGP